MSASPHIEMNLVGRNQTVHVIQFRDGLVHVFHNNTNPIIGLEE